MINYRVRQDNTSWSRYPKHKFAHSVNLGTVDTENVGQGCATSPRFCKAMGAGCMEVAWQQGTNRILC